MSAGVYTIPCNIAVYKNVKMSIVLQKINHILCDHRLAVLDHFPLNLHGFLTIGDIYLLFVILLCSQDGQNEDGTSKNLVPEFVFFSNYKITKLKRKAS